MIAVIDQTGGHIHQILDRDIPPWLFHMSVCCCHHLSTKSRKISTYRICQIDQSPLHQNHHCSCGDRFGHRIETINTVSRHRLFCLDIRITAFQIHGFLPFSSDHQNRARDLSPCHCIIKDPLQSIDFFLFHIMQPSILSSRKLYALLYTKKTVMPTVFRTT